MIRFYVNGNLSGYGDDDWQKFMPQIGSEFCISLDKDGKITSTLKKEHIMIVDQIIYSPYKSEDKGNVIFWLSDVDIYLVDKPKKSERNNID